MGPPANVCQVTTIIDLKSALRSTDRMKTLEVSLIGTAVGLGAWVFGIGQAIWSAHPQMACFLLTLVTTIVLQIAWPWLTKTDSR